MSANNNLAKACRITAIIGNVVSLRPARDGQWLCHGQPLYKLYIYDRIAGVINYERFVVGYRRHE